MKAERKQELELILRRYIGTERGALDEALENTFLLRDLDNYVALAVELALSEEKTADVNMTLEELIENKKAITNPNLDEKERKTLQWEVQAYKNKKLGYNPTWYMYREIAGLTDAEGKQVMVDMLDERDLKLPLSLRADKVRSFRLLYPKVWEYLQRVYYNKTEPRTMFHESVIKFYKRSK